MNEIYDASAGAPSQELLLDWLQPVQDPEMFQSLVDLGLIYNIFVDGDSAIVKMTLTSPACPSAAFLMDQVRKRMLEHPAIKKAEVQLVFEPKWDPATMASDEVKDKLGIW